MQDCVLVTEREFDKAKPAFQAENRWSISTAPGDEAKLAEAVRGRHCRAAIVGVDRYTGQLYEALDDVAGPNGAIIARFGVGYDNIDGDLARQHHIVVTNTPDVLTESVAELALWMMGGLARHIAHLDATIRTGNFSPETGMELQGKMLAVMGFGRIGRRVATIAHFGLGMKIVAEDNRPLAGQAQKEGLTESQFKARYGLDSYTTDPVQALQAADVVTIHMAVTPETRGFFSAQRLGAMKAGALLINTARGALIDEDALFDALASRHLGGAALDVFSEEPYRPRDPSRDLRTLPNTLLTPHVASDTHEADERMAQVALDNIERFFAGRLGELNWVAGYPVREAAPAHSGR
jgi:lactate dehydrogenase-like 2-hydroxyacid dehydrogenase